MASEKPGLVLLHGLSASGRAWQDVVPLLTEHCQVFAPTALGHRGGPPVGAHPTTITDIVDWAQGYLDEHELQRPYLVGHSMGGYVALELARRGRARSVCAIAPGGFWGTGDGLRVAALALMSREDSVVRRLRPVVPFVLRSATVRRLWFRHGAEHGDRISAARGVEILDDFLGCVVKAEVFSTDDQQLAPLNPLPCPVTVAWCEHDRVSSAACFAANARERLPHARFLTLPGVGHDAMMDAPELVARTILEVMAS